MNIREETELIGRLAGYTSSILKQIDQGWESRPGQNKANKLDPKKILSSHTDPAINIINQRTIKNIVPDAPTSNEIPNTPIQNKPTNQLEFDLPGITIRKPNYGPLEEFVEHFNKRMDKLEHEIILIKGILKEVKQNTTKRKYTARSNSINEP